MTTKQEALEALRTIQNEKWDNRIEAMERYKTACDRLSSFINSAPEWRPIDEYDYEKGGRVYVYTDEMCKGVAFYDTSDKGWRWDSGYPLWRDGGKPTHFLIINLPPNPKETQ